MTNITQYPLLNSFKTTLNLAYAGGTGTISLTNTPGFTFPSGKTVLLGINMGKTNEQVVRLDDWDNVVSISTKKNANNDLYTAQNHLKGDECVITDFFEDWDNIATAVESKSNIASPVFTGSVGLPKYADATARDTAIPSPTGNELILTGNLLQTYNTTTTQRETKDTGTPPPQASETAQGIIELATEAEALTGTDTERAMTPATTKAVIDNIDQSALYEEGLIAGESITANESLFLESQPKNSEIELFSPIGAGSSTTRVSETVFGSGVSGSTIVAPISKNASPSAFLRVTVETDNAGNPSGTLINANATVDIDPASLVDSQSIVNNHGFTQNYTSSGSSWQHACDFTINSSNDITNVVVQKFSSQSASQCRIKNSGGTVLSTVSFVGNYADFGSLKLTKSLVYRVECDISGRYQANAAGSYTGTLATITGPFSYIQFIQGFTARRVSDNETITFPGSFTIPKGTVCHLVMKQVGDVTNASNYYNICYKGSHTTARSLRDYNGSTRGSATGSKFVCLESIIFAKKVLSKTDADYTYKLSTNGISMFAKESASAGDVVNIPCFGPLGGFTGLEDVTYYVGNTPGTISATAGTNSQKVGKGISDTNLFISGSMTP